MDFETYAKIKRGKRDTISALINQYCKKGWFVAYCITENVCRGAPVLMES